MKRKNIDTFIACNKIIHETKGYDKYKNPNIGSPEDGFISYLRELAKKGIDNELKGTDDKELKIKELAFEYIKELLEVLDNYEYGNFETIFGCEKEIMDIYTNLKSLIEKGEFVDIITEY